MSKTKLLLDLITDIRSVADDLEAIVNSATESEATAEISSSAPAKTDETPPPTMADTAFPAPSNNLEPNERIDPETGEIVSLDLPTLRALVIPKAQTKEQSEKMKALLKKHGVDRLSKLPLSEYFIFQKEVEALV